MVDPFVHATAGVFSGSGVRVRRRVGSHRTHPDRHVLCTPRFCARRHGGVLDVEHDLRPDELSDDLAVLIAEELDDTGVLHGQPEFELVFTGIVRSTVDGAMPAWLRFYRNSLEQARGRGRRVCPGARACRLAAGQLPCGRPRVLLRLLTPADCRRRNGRGGDGSERTDHEAAGPRRAERCAGPCRRSVAMRPASRYPTADADTVTVVHLLEHLTPGAAGDVLDEALRLARRRVVVAVPFEDEPRACYGHIQRFDIVALRRLAVRLRQRHPGLRAGVHEYHGGWLILDRLG